MAEEGKQPREAQRTGQESKESSTCEAWRREGKSGGLPGGGGRPAGSQSKSRLDLEHREGSPGTRERWEVRACAMGGVS